MKRMVTALVLAAAAPTAASAHEFVVYFGFDSAVVPEGHFTQSMLDAACHAVWGDTDVYVVARADSAGPAAYNLALSERRAKAVADILVQAGVKRERITLRAVGETQPAVATGDGVREPLNRSAYVNHGGPGLGAKTPPVPCGPNLTPRR